MLTTSAYNQAFYVHFASTHLSESRGFLRWLESPVGNDGAFYLAIVVRFFLTGKHRSCMNLKFMPDKARNPIGFAPSCSSARFKFPKPRDSVHAPKKHLCNRWSVMNKPLVGIHQQRHHNVLIRIEEQIGSTPDGALYGRQPAACSCRSEQSTQSRTPSPAHSQASEMRTSW